MRFGLVVTLLLMGLGAGAAGAQTALVQAVPVPAPLVLEIGGKQVPLAEGPWIAAGDAPGRVETDVPLGGFGVIRNLVLLRPAANGRSVTAMAEINTNQIGIEDGWGLAADCLPVAGVESAILVRGGWDIACWFVTAREWDWTAEMPLAWHQAQAAARQRRLALPDRTVTVGLRVADRQGVIDLRFHLQDGKDAPDRVTLANWAVVSLRLLEAGLTKGLPAGRALPPFDAGSAALARAGVTQERIARLHVLVAEGALTEEEARRQEAAIRDAAAHEGTWSFDPDTVDGLRWGSLQVGQALTDASLTFLWTAQSLQAAAVTALQTSLRSARSYLTSVVWNTVRPVTRADAARVVDFGYGGHKAGL